MKKTLTFKRYVTLEQASDIQLTANFILEIEDILRKIEEVKEFTYKGYSDEHLRSQVLLRIKFEVDWG
ncbi:hypothetical protein [Sphingobacterium sp.]|uniref:hypothetical protein n=1 Tax=Sphingobacterium sp. TaxID=341027 RepID=UPI002896DB1C|nr:hypothetical protein [Sphingobacterium sp.]